MFIAIIGTRYSGKSTVANFLVQKGFQPVELVEDVKLSDLTCLQHDGPSLSETSNLESPAYRYRSPLLLDHSVPTNLKAIEYRSLPSLQSSPPRLQFFSPKQLLDHVTRNWRSNFVTLDLNTRNLISLFARRPFFMLVRVDAPLLDRFYRRNSMNPIPISLEDFVREHDGIVYGSCSPHSDPNVGASLYEISTLDGFKKLDIMNSSKGVTTFHSELETLDLLNPTRLRPSWDDYFMTLACLASQRSNCMKRRVGVIIVRENRILATGYNGTPRGLKNCNDGGCLPCNNPSSQFPECLCIHAEENALLEAGRERVGDRAVLYCNTCPCLKCTVKIIQTGVKEVVYNLTYKMDDESAKLFKEAGVSLRRHRIKSSSI